MLKILLLIYFQIIIKFLLTYLKYKIYSIYFKLNLISWKKTFLLLQKNIFKNLKSWLAFTCLDLVKFEPKIHNLRKDLWFTFVKAYKNNLGNLSLGQCLPGHGGGIVQFWGQKSIFGMNCAIHIKVHQFNQKLVYILLRLQIACPQIFV